MTPIVRLSARSSTWSPLRFPGAADVIRFRAATIAPITMPTIFGVDRRRPNLDGFVLRVRAHRLKLVSASAPSLAGSPSLTSVAQPPDERPDRGAVDVQDMLGDVDTSRLVLRIVAVGVQLHVVRVEPHQALQRVSTVALRGDGIQ